MTDRGYEDLRAALPAQIRKLLDGVILKMITPEYKDVNKKRVAEIIYDLTLFKIEGTASFLRKLMKRAKDKDALFDMLKEGRFAGILAKNGFNTIKLEPFKTPDSGPDVEACYQGEMVYFEITRRRAAEDEWLLGEPDAVGWIGVDRIENIVSRIQRKTTQLVQGEKNIIVLWSDTFRVDEVQMAEAFKYIEQEIALDPKKYINLSAVLFTTGGVSFPDLKQFYLHVNKHGANKLSSTMIRRLQTMTERDPLDLKRDHDALAEALERLHSRYGSSNETK